MLSIVDIMVCGILFSLLVYYFDSIWMSMAAHPQEYVEQIEAFIGNNEERRIYNSSYSRIPD